MSWSYAEITRDIIITIFSELPKEKDPKNRLSQISQGNKNRRLQRQR